MSVRSKKRQEKRRLRREQRIADTLAALKIPCPVCPAQTGVWCFPLRSLGPEMHGLRRKLAVAK